MHFALLAQSVLFIGTIDASTAFHNKVPIKGIRASAEVILAPEIQRKKILISALRQSHNLVLSICIGWDIKTNANRVGLGAPLRLLRFARNDSGKRRAGFPLSQE